MTPSSTASSARVSIILCTYRPDAGYLQRVLDSIHGQSLATGACELIVVDSASPDAVAGLPGLRWPSATRIIRAPAPGLALARTIGFSASRAPLIAFVDDDTVLAPDYLTSGIALLELHPSVAAISGRIRPEFEVPPPEWVTDFNALLAIRDFGSDTLISDPNTRDVYPQFAPVGVNICRREFFEQYVHACESDSTHLDFGRKGTSLASGEDNDFIMSVLRSGAQVAYCPTMWVTHLLPARRLETKYLGRLNRASSRTWEQVLWLNGFTDRPRIANWTVPVRQYRAWWRCRTWRGPREWIRWQGACGHFEGRVAATNRHLGRLHRARVR